MQNIVSAEKLVLTQGIPKADSVYSNSKEQITWKLTASEPKKPCFMRPKSEKRPKTRGKIQNK